jgi:hypothetical protein
MHRRDRHGFRIGVGTALSVLLRVVQLARRASAKATRPRVS